MNSKVRTSNQLNAMDLRDLHNGEIIALRVPGFYPTSNCEQIASRMSNNDLYGKYANAPLIGRVGQAYFECLASETHRACYEDNAISWIAQMRTLCEPYLTPIDKLRLELDEVWPSGSKLATLNGKKMFVGLARIFSKGASAEAHQDILSWDAPNSDEARELESQFAANIYLKMPEGGGELMIWPKSLSYEEYQLYKISNSYGVNTDHLSVEPFRITPQIGELILFNSTMLHAVSCPNDGDRVTWSCFIGDRGYQKPLMMWS